MTSAPKRPRKGHHVAFACRVGELPPQQSDALTGLRFRVEAAHGGSALIDLVNLKPRRLALAFASALRELAPTVARSTVLQHVNGLKRFFRYLNETAPKVDGPEQMRPEHIDGFERWLEAEGATSAGSEPAADFGPERSAHEAAEGAPGKRQHRFGSTF